MDLSVIKKLTYVQLSSLVSPSFWSKLTEIKLDVDKLSETERHIWGYYPIIRNRNISFTFLEVDSTSFNQDFNSQNNYIQFDGKIINKNTIEQFKECNKVDILNEEGSNLYKKILSGEALQKPSVLNCFLILSFADLKKYHYYFWFAFPVVSNVVIEVVDEKILSDVLTLELRQQLYKGFRKLSDHQKPYFTFNVKTGEIGDLMEIKNLTSETALDIYFVFFNISNSDGIIGAQLRNFALLLTYYCPFLSQTPQKLIALQCTREGVQLSIDKSLIYTVKLPLVDHTTPLNWVGWEKNERGKMGPRMANMKNSLDPKVLAENSIDLNLKLMKWRVVPDIDLDKVRVTKCLLLGAGTLGCSVARCLLAWGVRNITLVDNSTVSFSNPVRQSLFTYEDSVKMRPKAQAAAERLKEIFPGVLSKGVQLTIPMPGHSVGESTMAQTLESVETLKELIKSSDVIFLLMDSRESRWLPTMLGAFYNKVVINAALGFDSYLVMRHGCKVDDHADNPVVSQMEGFKVIQGQNLGCYFCNDVTAPGDSLKNRTLDQQCTVTRPGVSQIAGALAVELAVSVLQHKDGIGASAYYQSSRSNVESATANSDQNCILGIVPHSIRGFLSTFSEILPATVKYDQCVACSKLILTEYEKEGTEFLLKVFNSSKHLEDVAKLTELFNAINLDEVTELSDEISD